MLEPVSTAQSLWSFGLWILVILSPVLFFASKELGILNAKKRFAKNGFEEVLAGLRKSDVFGLMTINGPKIVLAPKFAQEIRSNPALSVSAFSSSELHAHIRGFDVFRQGEADDILQDTVRSKITQSIGELIQPLSEECSLTLKPTWTDSPEWHEVCPHTTILDIIARLSSRAFIGDELCRNPEWLRLTVDFTVDSFRAAEALNWWPYALRPLVARFLPSCRKLHKYIQDADNMMKPVLESRRQAQAKDPQKSYPDTIQWFEETAQGRPYDPVRLQLTLAFASIHTTADLVIQTILDLCSAKDWDELCRSLREEIISSFREEGWRKPLLAKLKIMDSALKESQRLKPVSIVGMGRIAKEAVKLSNNTIIPKGTRLLVSNTAMWDPEIYPDPRTYDPYRFLRLREASENESAGQLVSLSPTHLSFGLGKHACPGRFFAAAEVKIILCHILLKYDIKLADGCKPKPLRAGTNLVADPTAKLLVRRRQEEVAL
ncbi:cytochrome P450 [Aspergillus terreus]|uniref:Cytochrome P450 n=1 Tax=Aspergillus terreus TaxID=33178 RepID=A0A5M3ZE18_ASPTE|nr:hypothetical protein ATETN484_0016012100 [Aspergillus terreus]GFF21550.1 cytochrome P450 [Aspergillus terreus]